MWLKLCLLLIYILLLFILSRILDALTCCESSYNWALSRQLLDPMVLSVAKLKALLEQRGVNYEGVVDKSELTSLVETSGQISAEEAEISLKENVSSETNFTSGAHFIEQVEDAKDSVWLVQVVSNIAKFPVMSGTRWKVLKEKAYKFGIRTGFLDCSLDSRYCNQKGWQSPFLLLALPSHFEKKASVALYNYSGSVKETAVFRWVRDKLNEKVERINDPIVFNKHWQNFSSGALEPEIRAVLFTKSTSAPLFYSALSVKFPGRVKFGLVCIKSTENQAFWNHILGRNELGNSPFYVTYIVEKNYTYGLRPGELYNFSSMERFLKFLYPCLNDIFIGSFFVANILSWFEYFISNCGLFKRFRKFIWCVFKYNIAVIILWLPVIGIFQMPYLDNIPLIALKMTRIFSTSYLGTVLRGDYCFFINNPIYIFVSFGIYLVVITVLCKKYRHVDPEDDNWFNFSHMRTHAYLRPNNFIEPISRYDLLSGLDVFSSHLSQPSLWLSPSISMDYIKHLPTWRYCPVPLSSRAADNSRKVEMALNSATVKSSDSINRETSVCTHDNLSTNGLEMSSNSFFEKETDQQKSSSLDQVADSNDEPKRTVYSFINSQKSQSFDKSASPATPEQVRLTCTRCEQCSTTNPIRPIPDCPGHHCQCKSLSQNCDPSVTSCSEHRNQSATSCSEHRNLSATSCSEHINLPISSCSEHRNLPILSCSEHRNLPISSCSENRSPHSFKPEIHDRCCSRITHSSTSNPSSEPVLQTYSKATNSAADKNSQPPSSASNGSGFPTGYLESHQCVICLDEYALLTMLCGLPCGHVFHESCIISWFNREKHFCPMCRWPSYKFHPQSLQRNQ